ncbi:MAG: hypothetical protein LJE96_03310 [Deltaproteobacteria bacterium]|nr:hypothetical protein [Deltaproteobacteria bacterium]
MLKLLFFGVLAYFAFRFVQKARLSGRREHGHPKSGSVDEMVQDPNCLTYISKVNAIKKNVGGETHFFCSQACAEKFQNKKM